VLARPEDPGADAPSGSADAPPATRRRRAGAGVGAGLGDGLGDVVVVLVIVLQVAVPAVALMLPPPQRFGFQMYSGLGGVAVSIVDDEDVATAFDGAELLVGKLRPELDWLPTLPEAVCEAVPEAATVRVEQSGRERTVECD
jgi:hypothetical protein